MKKYYLENMTQKQIRDLFMEMRISQYEDIEHLPYSIFNGILKAVHGKNKRGEDIVTLFSQFELIRIYNSIPSNYDKKNSETTCATHLKTPIMKKIWKNI